MNGALKMKTTSGEVDDSSPSYAKKFLISKEIVLLILSVEEWIMEIGFIKRDGKGWITNVKEMESWHFEH